MNRTKRKLMDTLGITTHAEYEAWVKNRLNDPFVTDEDLDRFNPDAEDFDAGDFWRTAYEIDRVSIVGGNFVEAQAVADEINRWNFALAMRSGLLNFLSADADILEIGAGFGSLVEYLTKHTKSYVGMDAVPRFAGCLDHIPSDRQFSHVISSNVFQHLSEMQVKAYLDKICGITPKGAWLSLGMTCHTGTPSHNHMPRTKDGAPCCITLGQFIPLRTVDWYVNAMWDLGFFPEQVNKSFHGYTVLHARKVL